MRFIVLKDTSKYKKGDTIEVNEEDYPNYTKMADYVKSSEAWRFLSSLEPSQLEKSPLELYLDFAEYLGVDPVELEKERVRLLELTS